MEKVLFLKSPIQHRILAKEDAVEEEKTWVRFLKSKVHQPPVRDVFSRKQNEMEICTQVC